MRLSTKLLSLLLLLPASVFGATATIGTLNVTTLQSSGAASTIDYGPEDTWGYGTANQFTIEFVTVSDTDNPARQDPAGNWVGNVDYEYAVAKYSATEDQLTKAKAIGGFNTTFSSLGTNMPATQIDHIEAMQFVNWLNVKKGYPKAYNIDISGSLLAWPDSDDWAGGTNQIRNGAALYHLPSANEYYKAAQWDEASATWFLYGQGTNTPIQVNGYWANGSTNFGTAVCNQQFDARYPEWDSPGNIVNVIVDADVSGVITNITYDSFVSGHVVFESTDTFKIVQGAVTNATATVATWQKIENVPGTFTNFVAGTGYTDGVGSITLSGHTVGVRIYTDGSGGVVGAEPTSGRFNSADYTTVLDIVQAGGSGATCKVLRYVEDTYTDGVRVPETWTIVSGGSGYSDGAATFQTRHFGQLSFNDWLEVEPTTGLQYYKLCVGAAEVTRAGGPSPWGAVGMFGNVSNLTDTEQDFINDGSTTWFRYYGFWWERNAVITSNLGSEAWNVATPTTGAWSNGFRVAKRLE